MPLVRGAALLSVLWIGAVAVICVQSWPTIPLDLDARDAALQAAFRQAAVLHVLKHAGVALAPAALLIGAARWIAGRRKRADRAD